MKNMYAALLNLALYKFDEIDERSVKMMAVSAKRGFPHAACAVNCPATTVRMPVPFLASNDHDQNLSVPITF